MGSINFQYLVFGYFQGANVKIKIMAIKNKITAPVPLFMLPLMNQKIESKKSQINPPTQPPIQPNFSPFRSCIISLPHIMMGCGLLVFPSNKEPTET